MATSTGSTVGGGTTFYDPQASVNEQNQLAVKIIREQSEDIGIDPKDALRLAELFCDFASWRANQGFDPNWVEAFSRREGTQSIQFDELNEFAACKPGSRIAGQPIT